MAAVAFLPTAAMACTSAIIDASANPYGRPILWKHRDTSNTDNKVEFIPAENGSFCYVALFNANDKHCREAWIGMNEAGFAVMNTASYNIKDDRVPEKKMDREGYLMTKALKTCVTVDDFENLLKTEKRPMGVEANFGVIDATGSGAYFETNNHSFERFNLKDAPGGVLVRTNYSHSGRPNEGYGFIREANAETLLRPYIDERQVTPELLTECLSRSFYHDGRKCESSFSPSRIITDSDFIPRYKSTATIAIEGCLPSEGSRQTFTQSNPHDYIMWTGLGYPPVSKIRAVYCRPDGVPFELRGTTAAGHSTDSDRAKAIRDSIFSSGNKKDEKLVNVSSLFNRMGTGIVQNARTENLLFYISERRRRNGMED